MSEITSSELQKLSHKNQVRFALFCAKSVSHLNPNRETQLAIKTVELWLDNKATTEECEKAADVATGYAVYAGVGGVSGGADAAYAPYAASYAAKAATYAAAGGDADAANIYAARAAAAAARAAGYAHDADAGYAARNKAIQAQREYYNELS